MMRAGTPATSERGGDDGAGADAGVVEDGGPDADEDGVFQQAAMDGGVVTNGAELADGDGEEVPLAVEDGAILDVGTGADVDAVDVAAEDGVHPDAGLLAQGDVSKDLGGGIDVAGGVDGGVVALEGAEHGLSVDGWKEPDQGLGLVLV